jgi:hypothetical protein
MSVQEGRHTLIRLRAELTAKNKQLRKVMEMSAVDEERRVLVREEKELLEGRIECEAGAGDEAKV